MVALLLPIVYSHCKIGQSMQKASWIISLIVVAENKRWFNSPIVIVWWICSHTLHVANSKEHFLHYFDALASVYYFKKKSFRNNRKDSQKIALTAIFRDNMSQRSFVGLRQLRQFLNFNFYRKINYLKLSKENDF